jgi:hypothetical protein
VSERDSPLNSHGSDDETIRSSLYLSISSDASPVWLGLPSLIVSVVE